MDPNTIIIIIIIIIPHSWHADQKKRHPLISAS